MGDLTGGVYILSAIARTMVDAMAEITIGQWEVGKDLLWDTVELCYNMVVYRQTSNISRSLVGNKMAHQSDVVGASPIGAAPTTSSFST